MDILLFSMIFISLITISYHTGQMFGYYSLIEDSSPSNVNIVYDDLTPEIIAANRLIINTTPVGMYPHIDQAPDIPYEELTSNHYLFDLVYNPERTLFLERGAIRGAHTLSGLDMLYAQAESAWKIWNE